MISVAALLLAAALLTAPPHRRFPRPQRGLPAIPLAVPAGAVLLIAGAAAPAWGVAVAALAAMVQWRRRRARLHRIRRGEGEAMTAALETLVGELRVGAHPLRAFTTAAAEADGTVGAALRTVTSRVALGADVAAGLRTVAAHSAVPFYWDRIAVFWRLASDHGLAMSALMRAAQRDIVDRQRFSARVQAGLAGARATAAILAGLPVLGILLGQLIGARPVEFLQGSVVGEWLLLAGVGFIIAGVLWSDRIVDRLSL